MSSLASVSGRERAASPQEERFGARRADVCEYRDLGCMAFGTAFELQQDLVARRKNGLISDQLLFVEHPHVITLGRNAKRENVLISEDELRARGIELQPTDRGGDVTYHGPGQLVVYPIFDLRKWKRSVAAYAGALEQAVIDTVAPLGIDARRIPGCSGVWVGEAKLASIGVHISRWVTWHGLALNVSPNLDYFRYIVPCGIDKPVTSIEKLTGKAPRRDELISSLVTNFGKLFHRSMRSFPE